MVILSRWLEGGLVEEYSRESAQEITLEMTRDISQDDFLAATADTLAAVSNHSFVISKNGEFVAALVSERDYVDLRKLRAQRVRAALDSIGEAVAASGANEEELRELEKALDRHA